ncbi:DNA polymerase Y family protein [Mucilaginibacter limnophilus]|uniref:DNA polymerase Y family protein n=1 Tax=Mucilaginibacter limnophilus TaxID=1932778 RepID=A0A3S2VP78_9SPHI|nr:DNA polymerase Y family protein [Mucilaginibacter limnophilus]RVU02063.1 DNA polymerase Y family protein [Mucilaginibacter limnophilus]
MQKRFMAIWFRHLLTDGLARRRPELRDVPFVLAAPHKNRMVIVAASDLAEREGAFSGMAVADARAATSDLVVMDEIPGQAVKLLRLLGLGCIRYTPIVSIDLPDKLILDITGCAHLWSGEREYLSTIVLKLRSSGFDARAAIADTIGAAWAVAQFGQKRPIVTCGGQAAAISPLPLAALRLEPEVLDRLQKLGFRSIGPLLQLPSSVLRRRFGQGLLLRIDQALGRVEEYREALVPPVPYSERLPCLEPVRTAPGIELAMEKLLTALCSRLQTEGTGLRKAFLKCHRIDGRKLQVGISTTKGSHSVSHLMRLFQLQVSKIEPALGIELFVLEATRVEPMETVQEQLWAEAKGLGDTSLTELLDRISGRVGAQAIRRFLPAEHYWPERSVRLATSLDEQPGTAWPQVMRPIRLLPAPEPIEVMALVPDHPPKVFVHKGKRHTVIKADGPERIGREWWQDSGEHRDYYLVEDDLGQRYWVFRSGHYDGNDTRWYLHGYFA